MYPSSGSSYGQCRTRYVTSRLFFFGADGPKSFFLQLALEIRALAQGLLKGHGPVLGMHLWELSRKHALLRELGI